MPSSHSREQILWRIPLPTYHRCVSGEPSFLYLVSPLLVVVGILGLFSLSWAISTRPSWQQARNELYGFLLFAGAVAVFIAFSFLALNYLPGPDWLPCRLCWALRDVFSHPQEVW